MSGGSKGTTTNVNQNFSPEEAAMRARVMGSASGLYDQQSAGSRVFDQAGYDAAMGHYNSQMTAAKAGGIKGIMEWAKSGTKAPDPNSFFRYTGAPGANGLGPTGPTADTLAAQSRLRDFSTGAGQEMANSASAALKFGLGDVLYPESNPALQATLDTATRQVGEAYTSPMGPYAQIRSNFGSQEGRGSREAIALGLAGRSYLNTVGDVTGKITSDAYGKGLDTFSRTMAFAPQAYNLAMNPAVTQDAVGQQIEGYAEQERDWALNGGWQQLQNYANVVFGGSSPGTTTTSNGPGTGSVQKAGMAMSGASMGFAVGGPYGAAIGAGLGLLLGS